MGMAPDLSQKEPVLGKDRARNNCRVSLGSYGRQTVVVAAHPRSGERSYNSYFLRDPNRAYHDILFAWHPEVKRRLVFRGGVV